MLLQRSVKQEADYQRLLAFAQNHEVGISWAADTANRLVYETLIAATIDIPDESNPYRRPSMFSDGTKIGFSFQAQLIPENALKHHSLRMLVEPGGVGIDLPNQINFALATINRLLTQLSWQHLSIDINRIVRIVFPREAVLLSSWWGGIWLGAEIADSEANIRIYLNLRSGSPVARWQRVADVLGPYAPKNMESNFLTLIEQVSACAGIPVGLALVLKNGQLGGIRLYVGIDDPTPESVCAAMPREIGSVVHLRDRLKSLVHAFGPFEYNAVTVAYDFAFKADAILPSIDRFKADIGCSDYQRQLPCVLDEWIERDFGREIHMRFLNFTKHLENAFGGSLIDYLSFGFRKCGTIERTCYLQPLGLAPELP